MIAPMYSSKRRYNPTKVFIRGSSARFFCIETILVYKLPRLTREEIEIKEMIGLQDIELKQTRFYQDAFKEGHEEGRQEGELTIILRLLGRRFSNLPESLVGGCIKWTRGNWRHSARFYWMHAALTTLTIGCKSDNDHRHPR